MAMNRRLPFDKVNPRYVLPSRHAIFIRGLPGTTDVGRVRDFFSNESNTKCSIDFFSTSEDKKRFSVAIRFKSHEVAREMLARFNGKTIFGYPVDLCWFKDLKKARAKLYGEPRPLNKQFFRGNARGNYRGSAPDRRGLANSPGNYYDTRRIRTGSSSSGGFAEESFRDAGEHIRCSQSRSRSFSGSSSRSRSNSARSRSHSGSNLQHSDPNSQDMVRDYSGGHMDRSTEEREVLHKHSRQSRSASTSTSRSSVGAKKASPQRNINARRNAVDYGRQGRRKRPSNSPITNANFSNNQDDLSSCVSDASAKGRGSHSTSQKRTSGRSRRRHSSGAYSSGASIPSSREVSSQASGRVARNKRLRSPVPKRTTNKVEALHPGNKNSGQSNPEIPKRKRKQIDRSPASQSSNHVYHDKTNDSRAEVRRQIGRPHTPDYDHSPSASKSPNREKKRTAGSKSVHARNSSCKSPSVEKESTNPSKYKVGSGVPRSPESITENNAPQKKRKWSPTSSERDSRRQNPSSSIGHDSNGSEASEQETTGRKKAKVHNCKPQDQCNDDRLLETSEDVFNLIRDRKDNLAEDYKRDCEAFTTVVRTLISKDPDLESRLMPMLKEILHERGQRCIEDLRSFIAEHQPGDSNRQDGRSSPGGSHE